MSDMVESVAGITDHDSGWSREEYVMHVHPASVVATFTPSTQDRGKGGVQSRDADLTVKSVSGQNHSATVPRCL